MALDMYCWLEKKIESMFNLFTNGHCLTIWMLNKRLTQLWKDSQKESMHSNPIHCKLQVDYPCFIIFKLHLDWNYLHIWAPMGPIQGKLKQGMSDDDVTVQPWLPFKQNWWPFCSEQLDRQIIHQNARNLFITTNLPSPPALLM